MNSNETELLRRMDNYKIEIDLTAPTEILELNLRWLEDSYRRNLNKHDELLWDGQEARAERLEAIYREQDRVISDIYDELARR